MKVIVLGLKHNQDYYVFYGKNFASYDIGIKSRNLKLGYPVNTKLVSLFPYNTFSGLDIGDINDPNYHLVYLYADVKISKAERDNMTSGNLDSCLLRNKQVKLLGETENPYHDLVNKKNMFDNSNYSLYDILTWDFPMFCNEDNQEDFKQLINQYIDENKDRYEKNGYQFDFSITDNNFRLFSYLIKLSHTYDITFGRDGQNTVHGKTIIKYYQTHKLHLDEFRVLALGYWFNGEIFNATIKVANEQGLINKLSQKDKVLLYNQCVDLKDISDDFIKNNYLNINDLFKAIYQSYKDNDEEDLKLLKDKSYQPEEQQEDPFIDGEDNLGWYYVEDVQQDIVDSLFAWYPYLDKNLMSKITKNYAPRVKQMLGEIKK